MNITKIWCTIFVLLLIALVMAFSDSFKPIVHTSKDSAFITALSQLGILYIIALFVERSLEVFIKAWRQSGKVLLEQKMLSADGKKEVGNELEKYKVGTQNRALLLGLFFGVLISLSGVRILGAIFEFNGNSTAGFSIQYSLFQVTDILLTAGLIAGGSKTIHELMALTDNFLRNSRKLATTPIITDK